MVSPLCASGIARRISIGHWLMHPRIRIMWYEPRPSTRRNAEWKPVRPATAWIRVDSGASARVISGHVVLMRHPQYVVRRGIPGRRLATA
jgi:hypothetical protein